MSMNENVALLPFVAIAASLALLPAAAGGLARAHATAIALAGPTLAALLVLLLLHAPASDVPAPLVLFATLGALGASLAASPLIDRARRLASLLLPLRRGWRRSLRAPGIGPLARFVARHAVRAAAGGGVGGPGRERAAAAQPLRHTPEGMLRGLPAGGIRLLAGWALLAALLAMLAHALLPSIAFYAPILAMGSAALITLARAGEDAPGRAGEAACAALLLALPAALSPLGACLAGMGGAFLAGRSDAVAQSLRLDDPLRLIGAVLLPAAVGWALPGLLDFSLLAAALKLLGFALLAAATVSVVLWPLTMIFFGLALPRRTQREGMRR